MESKKNRELFEEENNIPGSSSVARLISAITDFILAYFVPNRVLLKGIEGKNKLRPLEVVIHSEEFFTDYQSSFKDDESKCLFIINKLTGLAKKWGLSLLTDGILKTIKYEEFKRLLENFDLVWKEICFN